MFILLLDTRRFAGTHNECRCKVLLNPASRVGISKRNQRIFVVPTNDGNPVELKLILRNGGPLYKSGRGLINLGSDTAR